MTWILSPSNEQYYLGHSVVVAVTYCQEEVISKFIGDVRVIFVVSWWVDSDGLLLHHIRVFIPDTNSPCSPDYRHCFPFVLNSDFFLTDQ